MRRALLGLLSASFFSIAAPAFAEDDVGAAREAICCGATCCLIDGMCLHANDENPTNPCQICDPSQSQAQWTTVEGCSPAQPDAGSSTPPDAGSTTPPPSGGGGCAVGTGGGAPLGLIVLAVAALRFRRRR